MVPELFLLLPLNTLFLAARVIGKHPRYRSLLWRDVSKAARWLWRGECPVPPVVVLRWPVTVLISRHVQRRLTLVRRLIALEEQLTDADRARLLARIDENIPNWQRRGLLGLIYSVVLPGIGGTSALISLGKLIESSGFSGRVLYSVLVVAVLLVLYIVPIPASLFGVKRGLMLGRTGRNAYFPGGTPGRGVYDEEAALLNAVGVRRREFPADLVLNLVYPAALSLAAAVTLAHYQEGGAASAYAVYAGALLLLFGFSLWRRARTNRW